MLINTRLHSTCTVTEKYLRELYLTAKSKNDKHLEEAVFAFAEKNVGKLQHDEDWEEFLDTHPEFAVKVLNTESQ